MKLMGVVWGVSERIFCEDSDICDLNQITADPCGDADPCEDPDSCGNETNRLEYSDGSYLLLRQHRSTLE